jgi:hypothetical protein
MELELSEIQELASVAARFQMAGVFSVLEVAVTGHRSMRGCADLERPCWAESIGGGWR